jgi:hypothetical protein
VYLVKEADARVGETGRLVLLRVRVEGRVLGVRQLAECILGMPVPVSRSLAFGCLALQLNLLYHAVSVHVVLAGLDGDAAPVVGETDRLAGGERTHADGTKKPTMPTIRRSQHVKGGTARPRAACVQRPVCVDSYRLSLVQTRQATPQLKGASPGSAEAAGEGSTTLSVEVIISKRPATLALSSLYHIRTPHRVTLDIYTLSLVDYSPKKYVCYYL